MNSLIKNVVIVGGGSAGWMTAAMLAKQLNNAVNITLIESEEIGTIGVGEATIPPIKRFNALLGIDESEFIKFCNGSIKLAIEFENWRTQNHKYMHPFGSFATDFDYMPFPYFWLQAKLNGDKRELQEFSLAWQLASKNKFMLPSTDPKSLSYNFDYAYHFDAGLYAKFLRAFAEKHGVTRVEGKVVHVTTEPTNHHIKSVNLTTGQQIDGDFFIDCSGQRAILLGDTLGVDFDDWGEQLFNDRAIAVQSAHMTSISPYTRSIAHHAGWQWRIPLQTRMGNGNVYSSDYMSDDEALTTLTTSIEGPLLTEPNFIKFKTGRRTKSWQHNCIAIGLSAGFLEPLESTSLHLIQSAIMRLIRLFPDNSCSALLQDEFNRETQKEYEHIRDFIILHYKATERDDSPYWQRCKDMAIPGSLQRKIDLFKQHGHLTVHDKELFKQDNWLAVLTGQGILPEAVAPIMAGKSQFDLTRTLDGIENNLKATAVNSMSHEMYLAKHWRHKAAG